VKLPLVPENGVRLGSGVIREGLPAHTGQRPEQLLRDDRKACATEHCVRLIAGSVCRAWLACPVRMSIRACCPDAGDPGSPGSPKRLTCGLVAVRACAFCVLHRPATHTGIVRTAMSGPLGKQWLADGLHGKQWLAMTAWGREYLEALKLWHWGLLGGPEPKLEDFRPRRGRVTYGTGRQTRTLPGDSTSYGKR